MRIRRREQNRGIDVDVLQLVLARGDAWVIKPLTVRANALRNLASGEG
jgi:hypothetical protein